MLAVTGSRMWRSSAPGLDHQLGSVPEDLRRRSAELHGEWIMGACGSDHEPLAAAHDGAWASSNPTHSGSPVCTGPEKPLGS